MLLIYVIKNQPTTKIYTHSLHDALPIFRKEINQIRVVVNGAGAAGIAIIKLLSQLGVNDILLCDTKGIIYERSEEHTSELQSHVNLVCRLLLEKKNKLQSLSSLFELL